MKPRVVNQADHSTWPVRQVLRPGVKGTLAELEAYGAKLLAVRYRATGGRRVKTVEVTTGARPGARETFVVFEDVPHEYGWVHHVTHDLGAAQRWLRRHLTGPRGGFPDARQRLDQWSIQVWCGGEHLLSYEMTKSGELQPVEGG